MKTQQDPAISYARFSDVHQSEGDSEGRQQRDFIRFCESHGLRPLQHEFIDRGLSGYKGHHRKKGDLGRLIELAKAGTFPPRTVLVVEAWDRLGRLRPDDQIELVKELLQAGLRIGICKINDIFELKDFGKEKFLIFSMFAQLAHQESVQKSERIGASWQTRKRLAREEGRAIRGRLPAWVEYRDGKLHLIQERAAVMRRIFALARDGYGQIKIVKTLTAEGVPPFGERRPPRRGRRRSAFRGEWTRPYVAKLLGDRRVIGEYQPRTADGKKDGPPIEGYYPAVLTEDEFLLAQGRPTRKARGPRTRQRKYVNLFSGLLHHAADGDDFLLKDRRARGRLNFVLINRDGHEGRGDEVSFPYKTFERAVLSRLREITIKDIAPPESRTDTLEVLKARRDHLAEEVAALEADLAEEYSRSVSAVLKKKEAEHAAAAEEYDREKLAQALPIEHALETLHGLTDVLDNAADPDDVRTRLRNALRRVVREINLRVVSRGRDRLAAVLVEFQGRHERRLRGYFICHRPAAVMPRHRRPGCWRVESWAHTGPESLLEAADDAPDSDPAAEAGLSFEEQLLAWYDTIKDEKDGWNPLPDK